MMANESKTPSQVFAEFQERVRVLEQHTEELMRGYLVILQNSKGLVTLSEWQKSTTDGLRRRIEELEARRE